MIIRPLPDIMVAPNGARRMRSDHPALPLTDAALLDTARACMAAGAGGIHAHIRTEDGTHLLDAGRYSALLDRLEAELPHAYHQVTSEAAGLYDASAQMQMVRELRPAHVSVALREMVPTEGDWPDATRFYGWALDSGVAIQHILYAPSELARFLSAVAEGRIAGKHHLLLFVLGSYDGDRISQPQDISKFTNLLRDAPTEMTCDWMVCAFGVAETACLVEALRQGGKARIGFENSLWHANGSLAASNEDRVGELVRFRSGGTGMAAHSSVADFGS